MATTRQPRQFLAVWNDEGTEVKGSTFEESLFVDGSFWKNEITPVAPESFGEFGAMFSNQLQIQHDALVAEKTTLLSEKATLTQEKALLESQVASLTSQVETLTAEKSTLTTEKAELASSVSTLTQEKSVLTSQVSSLTSQLAAKTSQVESLAEDKTGLAASIATLTQEKSSLTSQVSSLTSQLASKTAQAESLTADKATLTASLSAANARIANLLQEIPFNPREINVDSFKARLFGVLETEDVVRMYAAESDLVLKQIAATIANWDAAYPIRLDSEELQTPLGYLVHIDLLTPDEVVSLRRDATRAEAYFAPEE
jgi:predicted  nucleic acid-binding Zn-ribbon protein